MNIFTRILLGIAVAFTGPVMMAQPVIADGFDLVAQARGGGGNNKPGKDEDDSGGTTRTPIVYSWMSSEISGAWGGVYYGQNVTITVVDDFESRTRFFGNLGDGRQRLRHGDWTLKQAGMIAPSATLLADSFYSGDAVPLADGFNVINLSYGWLDLPDRSLTDQQEISIVAHATSGLALVSKSAGNDAIAVGSMITSGTYAGRVDHLAIGLIGTQSALFVGALNGNGTELVPASLASYSNFAGSDTDVQAQFLVVGVDSSLTGLAGTSFAAPIISGYAAVLSSKFTGADPTQVAQRLLGTARETTISGYDPFYHGQGEASILSAISPDSIDPASP